MKKIFIFLLSLSVFGHVFAQNETENKMLTCPRDEAISEKIDEVITCGAVQSLELSANDVLKVELEYFDQEIAEKILLDDISNPNWLAKKGVAELRTNRLCLENICRSIWNKCNTGKNLDIDNDQISWCYETADNIFEIQKIKIKTAVIENQKRKTRSTFREKFRAIEIRASQYFYPNLVSFTNEFTRFTEKVTAFIYSPLQ